MTPTKQEFAHNPTIGHKGDCHRAVIASLLDLPLSEVPHFLQEADGDPFIYWDSLQAFLHKLGYAWLVVPATSGSIFFGETCPIYHGISGPSPRGNDVRHAVVGLNGEIFFDPHPDASGLAGEPKDWEYGYLVKTSHQL